MLSKIRSKIAEVAAKSKVFFSKHKEELHRQINRNLEHRALDNAIIHSHRLIPQITKFVKNKNIKILSVGSCNAIEIYAFKSYGYNNVTGIDLVKPERDSHLVKIMDMHDMKFADNSFDLIFCSGTFHCSYNPDRLVSEFIRVLKNEGCICLSVPINFKTNQVYVLDLKSLEGLHSFFSPYIKELLWSEVAAPKSEFNPNNNEVARSIFTIKK